MKTKTTIILLILDVAVGLYIKFYESKRPNNEEVKRQAGNVINFDRDTLEGIVIQNGDDRIELKKQELKWRIEAPFKDQADGGFFFLMITAPPGFHTFPSHPALPI